MEPFVTLPLRLYGNIVSRRVSLIEVASPILAFNVSTCCSLRVRATRFPKEGDAREKTSLDIQRYAEVPSHIVKGEQIDENQTHGSHRIAGY